MSKIEELLSENPEFTPSVVAYFILDNKVLLGLRKKVSNGLGENLIAGVGGKVDPGETNEQAIIREVLEEINVNVTKVKEMGNVKFLFPHKPSWQQDMTIFLVEEWEGEPQETTVILPEWFNINDLPEEQMWDDNLYWLPDVLKNKKVNGIFLYNDNEEVIDHQLEISTAD